MNQNIKLCDLCGCWIWDAGLLSQVGWDLAITDAQNEFGIWGVWKLAQHYTYLLFIVLWAH